ARLAPDSVHRDAGLWVGVPHGLLQFLPEPWAVLLGAFAGVELDAARGCAGRARDPAGVCWACAAGGMDPGTGHLSVCRHTYTGTAARICDGRLAGCDGGDS